MAAQPSSDTISLCAANDPEYLALCAAFRIGQRVRALDSLDLATVRYIGPVACHSGMWVGVEWDDPSRGKHNGSYHGIRYFDLIGCETAGSFVRATKLCTQVSLMQAVTWKYEREQALELSQVPILVRDSDQAQLPHLEAVYLTDSCIGCTNCSGEIAAALPMVRELDISGNNLNHWEQVQVLSQEMPSLHVLNVSRMRMQFPTQIDSSTSFQCLSTIVLNETLIKWEEFCALHSMFPQLEELHLCNNAISSLNSGFNKLLHQCFPKLRKLNLDDNHISSWEEVMCLSDFAKLECLMLNGNRLEALSHSQLAAGSSELFELRWSCLRTLLLGGNQLSQWESVDELNVFPRLQEVRLTSNPLPALGGAASIRMEVVARVGSLVRLNGSTITPSERRDAELRYLRRIQHEQANSCQDVVERRHPRLQSLLEQYGNLEADGVEGGSGRTRVCLGEEMLNLTLRCVSSCDIEKRSTSTRLPASITISNLKKVCESVFKLKVFDQVLFLQHLESPIPEALLEDGESLACLGAQNGATILVDAKNS